VFYNLVTRGGGAVIEDLVKLLDDAEIRYCVIGGQAVNHYVEPLVSLDLDLVVATERLDEAEKLLADRFEARRFPRSINVTPERSDLRIQVHTDPRYGDYVNRAVAGNVLGIPMSVADKRDLLQGKVWAARRPSKRQKDLVDIARLVEDDPTLKPLVPPEIMNRIEA
ncbi:MAG: hypothetical protein ACRDSJ_20440, partial [Rubrobacteraceae bacterium]